MGINKTIVVNYVARHSTSYVKNMVESISKNSKTIAIVSRNMTEVSLWRRIQNLELIEIDGYTSFLSSPIKAIKFFLTERKKIVNRIGSIENSVCYIPFCSYWSLFVMKALNGMDYVYTMHDPVPHTKHSLMGMINKRLAKKATKTVILSRVFLPVLESRYHINREDILVLPSGPENNDVPAQLLYSYDESKINFVFHGQVSEYKGLDILSSAFRILQHKYDNIMLYVACSGNFSPYRKYFNGLLNCEITNKWFTTAEIKGLFNDKSVVVVLPYKSATQSGVLNTALANGSIVIASSCGGIPEQIVDSFNGFLVEPNSVESLVKKMEYVINHFADMKEIRENQIKMMKEKSWDILGKQLADFICEI